MTNKSIDINQRIPLETLEAALIAFLEDNYSNDYILELLRLEYEGENRLKKSLRIVNKIIKKSFLVDWLKRYKVEVLSALKRKVDRDIILIALLNTAYPFSFDVLTVFGKFFCAQNVVSAGAIMKDISNTYGGNRATSNGVYSIVPMFLEANFFARPQTGIYEFNLPQKPTSKVSLDIYIESYKVNKQINEVVDIQMLEPYFLFLEFD